MNILTLSFEPNFLEVLKKRRQNTIALSRQNDNDGKYGLIAQTAITQRHSKHHLLCPKGIRFHFKLVSASDDWPIFRGKKTNKTKKNKKKKQKKKQKKKGRVVGYFFLGYVRQQSKFGQY